MCDALAGHTIRHWMFSTTGLARLVRVGFRLVTGSRTVGWYRGGGTAMQAGRCSGSERTLHGAIERRIRMDQQIISGNCGKRNGEVPYSHLYQRCLFINLHSLLPFTNTTCSSSAARKMHSGRKGNRGTVSTLVMQATVFTPTPGPLRAYATDLDGTVVLLIGGRSFSGALDTCSWYAILQVVAMTGVVMY
jgi:hypothetical protein